MQHDNMAAEHCNMATWHNTVRHESRSEPPHMAEAAERRRVENERKCFPGNAADGVIDLCGDDERFAKRARNERGP